MSNSGLPLMERDEIHKSAKTLENVVGLLYSYCQTLSTLASIQKRLGRALKDASQVKGTHSTPANALSASANIFELLSDVDGKFAKVCEREYEALSIEVKKWFKRLAKEEKTLEEVTFSISSRIKQASQATDRKMKGKPRNIDTDLITSLGTDMSQVKLAHTSFVTQRHMSVLFFLGGSISRMADAEWVRSCEEVRRVATGVGKLGEWRAHCEGGSTYSIPGDLVDVDKSGPLVSMPDSKSQSWANSEAPNPAIPQPKPSLDSIVTPAPTTPIQLSAAVSPRVVLRTDSLPVDPAPSSNNSLLCPPTSLSKPGSSSGSVTSPSVPSSPTVKLTQIPDTPSATHPPPSPPSLSSSTPGAHSSLPFPSNDAALSPLATPSLESSSKPFLPPFSPASTAFSSTNSPLLGREPIQLSPQASSPFKSETPTIPNPFISKDVSDLPSLTQPKPTAIKGSALFEDRIFIPPRPTLGDRDSYVKSKNVAFEDDKTQRNNTAPLPSRTYYDKPITSPGPSERARPVGRSTSIDSTYSQGSHVAAMRDRFGERSQHSTSPPSRDMPRLQQSVTNLATRYNPNESTGRSAVPPSAFNDRYASTRDRYTSRLSYELDRERDLSIRELDRDRDRIQPRTSREWQDARDLREDRDREAIRRRREEEWEWYERDRDGERELDGDRDRLYGLRDRERNIPEPRIKGVEREREDKQTWSRDREYPGDRHGDRDKDRDRDDLYTSRRSYSPTRASTQRFPDPSPVPSGSSTNRLAPPAPVGSRSADVSQPNTHSSSCGCHECSAQYYATPSPSLSAVDREKYFSKDRLTSPSATSLNTSTRSPAVRPVNTQARSQQTISTSVSQDKDKKGGGWMGKGLRRLSMPIGAAFSSSDASSGGASPRTKYVTNMPSTEEDGRLVQEGRGNTSSMPVAAMRR